MLQDIEADLNEDYIKTKLDQSCGGAEPSDFSVLQSVAISSSMYRSNSSTGMSETDTSMLEKKTTGASHSHNKKQDNETMESMEHTEINKWPNSCKSPHAVVHKYQGY